MPRNTGQKKIIPNIAISQNFKNGVQPKVSSYFNCIYEFGDFSQSGKMRKNAEKRLDEFTKGFDFKDISLSSFLTRLEDKHYTAILDVAKKKDSNLIIIGERRKKTAAKLLLQSVTEQLIRTTPVPLLSVVTRGKGMSFFEALLRI